MGKISTAMRSGQTRTEAARRAYAEQLRLEIHAYREQVAAADEGHELAEMKDAYPSSDSQSGFNQPRLLTV